MVCWLLHQRLNVQWSADHKMYCRCITGSRVIYIDRCLIHRLMYDTSIDVWYIDLPQGSYLVNATCCGCTTQINNLKMQTYNATSVNRVDLYRLACTKWWKVISWLTLPHENMELNCTRSIHKYSRMFSLYTHTNSSRGNILGLAICTVDDGYNVNLP